MLENDEHIDVLVARARVDPRRCGPSFEDAWQRRRPIAYDSSVGIYVPDIDDLILAKRWSLRGKDLDDIELLEKLKRAGGGS